MTFDKKLSRSWFECLFTERDISNGVQFLISLDNWTGPWGQLPGLNTFPSSSTTWICPESANLTSAPMGTSNSPPPVLSSQTCSPCRHEREHASTHLCGKKGNLSVNKSSWKLLQRTVMIYCTNMFPDLHHNVAVLVSGWNTSYEHYCWKSLLTWYEDQIFQPSTQIKSFCAELPSSFDRSTTIKKECSYQC